MTFPASAQQVTEGLLCSVLDSGFIYQTAPFPSCHASTLVETGNGLLAAWFGGTHERHPDVCIYSASLVQDKWTRPMLIADGIVDQDQRYPCWNPVLYRRDNGDIILYYKVGPSPMEWWGMYKVSTDDGETWSSAVKIPGGLLGPIKNKPFRLPDGMLLYPTSYEKQVRWRIYTETSDQTLQSWQKTDIDNRRYHAIQPTVLSHPDGRLQLLCRSREQRILQTWSDDLGKTWTPLEKTDLPNNNAGIDAVTLQNGLHLLVCNPVTEGRHKLALLASADGSIWSTLLVLEDHSSGEFSYPAIIRDKAGKIHITYTYQRKKIKYVCLSITRL